jgi:hypothetical protein
MLQVHPADARRRQRTPQKLDLPPERQDALVSSRSAVNLEPDR